MSKRLDEKAMLVKLNIQQWTARKYDKKVTAEVKEMHHTVDEVGRFNKILIAQDEIRKIQQITTGARNFHYFQTLPWCDDGARILPAKNYDKYMTGMRKYREDFEKVVRSFIGDYPALIDEAKKRLNSMFSRDDYPDPKDIHTRYSYNVVIEPIPTATDFRVELNDSDISEISKDIAERTKTAQQNAMKELWQRLHEVVAKLHERIRDKDTIFKNTIIENISEVVDLIPALNIDNDAELNKMAKKVSESLCQYDPQTLRDDDKTRETAAKTADSILKAMAGYVGTK